MALVDGSDLLGAMKIVEENYGRYISIKAYRATVDEHGRLKDEEKAVFEISNLAKDELLRGSSDENAA